MIRVSDHGSGALGAYFRAALAESKGRMGGECMLGRISELMFVDVVRRYLETLPEGRMNWLAGLRDPYVGRALTALHEYPARDWTIEALAQAAALSRSAFAERFVEFVGHPPMQYLTNWRMQLATNYLRNGTESIARWPIAWVTIPRPRSAARSRSRWARRRPSGASALQATLHRRNCLRRCLGGPAEFAIPFSKTKHRSEQRNTTDFRLGTMRSIPTKEHIMSKRLIKLLPVAAALALSGVALPAPPRICRASSSNTVTST